MLIVAIGLFGLTAYAQLPMNQMDDFYSSNGVYAATLTPTQATVTPNQSQTFTITVSPTSNSITYVWFFDQKIIPVTGTSCFLFASSGVHTVEVQVTVNGNLIDCHATLTVTSNGDNPAPTATPALNNVVSLIPVAPLYRDLVAAISLLLAGFGSVNIFLSRKP